MKPRLVAPFLAVFMVAVAAWFLLWPGAFAAEPDSWTVPRAHRGDVLVYELAVQAQDRSMGAAPDEPLPSRSWWRIENLGPRSVLDEIHEHREVDAYRITGWDREGRVTVAFECFAAVGEADAVRLDVISGTLGSWYEYRRSQNLLQYNVSATTFETKTQFGGECFGRSPLTSLVVRQGASLPSLALRGLGVGDLALIDPVSSPAQSDHVGISRALTYAFTSPSEDRTLLATVIEGFPAFGRLREWRDGQEVASLTLVGYERGSGSPVEAIDRLQTAPDTVERRAPGDSWRFDDRAFGLRYAFDDAFSNALGDPSVCLRRFLAENPTSYLAAATYFRDWRDPVFYDVPNDGAWRLSYRAGSRHCDVLSVRFAHELPMVPSLARPVRNQEVRGVSEGVDRAGAASIVPSAILADRVRREGLDLTRVSLLSFETAGGVTPHADGPAVLVSGASSRDLHASRAVVVEAATGRLTAILAAQSYSEAGAAFPLGRPTWEAPSKSAQAGAVSVPRLGGALATLGFVALVLAIKIVAFLLSNRISRGRALEHPQRAAILAIVKAEPGIHQALVVVRAGGAYGSTMGHLRRLTDLGFIRTLSDGGFLRYYAAEDYPGPEAANMAVLKRGRMRDIYAFFRDRPGASLSEAAEHLDMSAPSIHRARKRLVAAGLLAAKSTRPPGESSSAKKCGGT